MNKAENYILPPPEKKPKVRNVSLLLYGPDIDKCEYLESIGVNMSSLFRRALRKCYEDKYHIPTATEAALGETLAPALLLLANYIEKSESERSIYNADQSE